jgi:hypothetical protein
VEGDNPASHAQSVFMLFPFVEYSVYPVIDIGEGVGLLAEGVEWRKSIK